MLIKCLAQLFFVIDFCNGNIFYFFDSTESEVYLIGDKFARCHTHVAHYYLFTLFKIVWQEGVCKILQTLENKTLTFEHKIN